MPTQSLFPTLIYRERLARPNSAAESKAGRRLRRDVLRESLIAREIDDEGRAWSEKNYVGGYTSYASLNELHRSFSTFEDLRRLIDRHVRKFARALEWDLQGGRLEMTTCWVNVMPAGAAHGMHLHPLSAISGTYYARMPKLAAPLKFEDPRLSRFMAAPPRRTNCARRNQAHVAEQAEEGDVVLFESWLRHEVPANRSKQDRITVSFNYDWV